MYIRIHNAVSARDIIQGNFSSSNLKFFFFDVAQGRMSSAPDENRTHSRRFASIAC